MTKLWRISLVGLILLGCGESKSNDDEIQIETKTDKIVATEEKDNFQSEVTIEPGGKHLEHYGDGKLKIEGQYDMEGKRTGLWISWYETGLKWSESYYIKGKRNGHSLTFYPNGKIRYIGEYKDDVQTGRWTFYDDEGNVTKEENY